VLLARHLGGAGCPGEPPAGDDDEQHPLHTNDVAGTSSGTHILSMYFFAFSSSSSAARRRRPPW
jgi:hypothetical protein